MTAGAVLALVVGELAALALAFWAGRATAPKPTPVALPPVVEHPDDAEKAALAVKEKAIDATPDAEILARARARVPGGAGQGG